MPAEIYDDIWDIAHDLHIENMNNECVDPLVDPDIWDIVDNMTSNTNLNMNADYDSDADNEPGIDCDLIINEFQTENKLLRNTSSDYSRPKQNDHRIRIGDIIYIFDHTYSSFQRINTKTTTEISIDKDKNMAIYDPWLRIIQPGAYQNHIMLMHQVMMRQSEQVIPLSEVDKTI